MLCPLILVKLHLKLRGRHLRSITTTKCLDVSKCEKVVETTKVSHVVLKIVSVHKENQIEDKNKSVVVADFEQFFASCPMKLLKLTIIERGETTREGVDRTTNI